MKLRNRVRIIRSTRFQGTEDLSYHEFDTELAAEEFIHAYNTIHLGLEDGRVPEVYTIAETDCYAILRRQDPSFKVMVLRFNRDDVSQQISMNTFFNEEARQAFIADYNAGQTEEQLRKSESYTFAIAYNEDRVV